MQNNENSGGDKFMKSDRMLYLLSQGATLLQKIPVNDVGIIGNWIRGELSETVNNEFYQEELDESKSR